MRRKERKIWQLLLGILSLGGFLYLAISYSPTFNLATTSAFFVLLFLSLWFLIRFSLKSNIQATLISVSAVSYLLVRTLGLKQPLFLLLFIILFVTLELFFKRS